MGIESTITYSRTGAIQKIKENIQIILDQLNYLDNDKLEEYLYNTRDTVFENYWVVDDNEYCEECRDSKDSYTHEHDCLGNTE